MKRARSVLGWVGLACVGCGTGSPVDPGAASGVVTGCEIGAPLAGAAYDIKKSRFAFGSTPIQHDASGIVRWVGVDGVVAIEQSGRRARHHERRRTRGEPPRLERRTTARPDRQLDPHTT
jgi:hypothetical protein